MDNGWIADGLSMVANWRRQSAKNNPVKISRIDNRVAPNSRAETISVRPTASASNGRRASSASGRVMCFGESCTLRRAFPVDGLTLPMSTWQWHRIRSFSSSTMDGDFRSRPIHDSTKVNTVQVENGCSSFDGWQKMLT